MSNKKQVIVIGGGLGGLSAAISLQQHGYDVTLYEQNNHLGGKVNRLEQDGFGFDLGPSILTMPHIFETLFQQSGKRMTDYVQFQRLNHQWRSFFPNGSVLDLHEGLQEMEERNPSLTSKDIKEYKKLLKYAKELYDITEQGYFKRGFDNSKEVMKYHGVYQSMRKFDLSSTMFDAINQRISHPQLRDMLSYIVKYVGSSAYHAPAVLNMMIYMQHSQGIFYVPGGMHHLANALVKLAEELGVTFHLGKKIVKLDKSKQKITAAYVDDGTKLTADYFISNMEVIPTYKQLIQEKPSYIDKLNKKFEPASSGLVLHVGVRNNYPQLAHHNFFFSRNMKQQMDSIFKKHKLPDDPVIYLVNVNKTDAKQAPAGHENLKILPHIPYIQKNHLTRQEYTEFAEKVLIKLENMGLERLRESIVTRNMWTPHDIERTYLSDRGAIYGTVSDKKVNKGFKHPKQSELYRNLYFVGGTVNPGAGMPMVTLSGQQVAKKVLESDKRNG
ncbi:phytoene desaturase family protein [Fredinandcohnia sp. QZ13]|uniref:phytoene desaturase family protein n=1 Tax=Fredinandcohnia sp. QZ13 TaxID=3073144 RepID=UPI0028530BBF|nr:phytoene desaturase family protein [Fredinandcohnia sp. QZ13]MDR4890455.1 phytoene desaturase family protein [Fredinandcohnia sp. QZ13]